MVNEALLRQVLGSPEPRARAAATRVLCYWRDRVSEPLELLRRLVHDDFPRVRLEAVRACSFWDTAAAAEVALESVQHPLDKFQRYGLQETLRALEPWWKAAVQSGQPFAVDNPAGIQFLLATIMTNDLLLMHRSPPVLQEILRRDAVSPTDRLAALRDLAAQNKTDTAAEWMSAVRRLDHDQGAQATAVLADLAHLTASHEPNGVTLPQLRRYQSEIQELAHHGHREITRQWALATAIDIEQSIESSWQHAIRDMPSLRDLLRAVPLVQTDKLRANFHPRLMSLLQQLPPEIEASLTSGLGCQAQYVRIDLPGPSRTLTLAEVEVISLNRNVASTGTASQSGTAYGGVAAAPSMATPAARSATAGRRIRRRMWQIPGGSWTCCNPTQSTRSASGIATNRTDNTPNG